MSQTDPPSSAAPAEVGLVDTEKIMAAIASCQMALMTKIDLQTDVNRLRWDRLN